MVRVISEKLFSPPRSRHSSSEAVDKELAARAVEALSGLNTRRLELSDYESSSDSHWDSEVDIEGDGTETPKELAPGEEECSGGADVLQKRKERRRERNKLSAQAYRIRRREQCVKQQNVLRGLQEKNSRLKDQVHSLVDQIDQFRRTAVQHPHPTPDTATTTSATAGPLTPPHAGDISEGLPPPDTPGQEGRSRRHLAVDNDLPRHQLLSPVVDNFSFSQPSPAASPGAAPSPSLFSFPVSPPSPSPCHPVGMRRTPTLFPKPSTFSPASCTSMEGQVGQGGGHPYPHHLFQPPLPPPPLPAPQHMDLNANAEEGHGNLNATHCHALGVRQKSDNVNNNTEGGFFPGSTQGGARPKIRAVGAGSASDVLKVSKA